MVDQNEDKGEMLAQTHLAVSLISCSFTLHLFISVVMWQEFRFPMPQGMISDGHNNIVD